MTRADSFPTGNLRGLVVSGVLWKFGSQAFQQALQIVTIVVLARLLGPNAYGLAGMVFVFSRLLTYFSDMAMGAAVIQRSELTHAQLSTAFWTTAATGVSATLVGFACSPLVARFYGEPTLESLFQALSLNFVLVALGRTQVALLQRQMRFRSIEIRNSISAVGGATAGVLLAVNGAGAWALIGQVLVTSTVGLLLVWRLSSWRPSFVYSRRDFREMGRFSGNVLGAQTLFFFTNNLDNLLIGKFVGAASLGAYRLSFNLMQQPVVRLAAPLRTVLYPAFARLNGDRPRLAQAWLNVNRLLAAVMLPGLVLLAVTAPDTIPVLLGDGWQASVVLVQVLCLVGMLQSTQLLNSAVLQALGMAGALLRLAGFSFSLNMIAFVIGLHWGALGVAVGAVIANSVVQPVYAHLILHQLELGVADLVGSLRGVVEASLLLAAAMLATRTAVHMAGLGGTASAVAIEFAVGLTTYGGACYLRSNDVFSEVARIVGDIRKRPEAGRPPIGSS
jgi:O-antigen/teichoic acid export membrane protein